MPTFVYRIHPWLATASPGDPGHPLYVHPGQGRHRIDNPGHYLVMYVAEAPAGAVAEVFGDHGVWTDDLFTGHPAITGSVKAISTYEAQFMVANLDDVGELAARGLRPSRVVTRHRHLTQAWALAIFHEKTVDGVRWWSYHEPDWGSIGLWQYATLKVLDVQPLHKAHPAVVEAAAVLNRTVA